MEGSAIGRFSNWKVMQLEDSAMVRSCNWEVPQLEGSTIGKFCNWKVPQLECSAVGMPRNLKVPQLESSPTSLPPFLHIYPRTPPSFLDNFTNHRILTLVHPSAIVSDPTDAHLGVVAYPQRNARLNGISSWGG